MHSRARSIAPRCLGAALLALSCWSSLPARAEPTAAEIAVARRLFHEATGLRQEEKWTEAAAKLREAIAIKETPGLRFHLAHCEEKLGHLVEAQVEYDRADDLIQGGVRAPDVESLLAPARASLHERIPTLRVTVPAGTAGVRMAIDARVVSAALVGEAVPLDPGHHAISVDAPGRKSATLEVDLAEGDDRVLEAALPWEETPAAAPRVVLTPHQKPAEMRRMPSRASSGASFGVRELVLMTEGAVVLGGVAVGAYGLIARGDAAERAAEAKRHLDDSNSREGDTTDCVAATTPACTDLAIAVEDQRSAKWFVVGGFVGAGVGAAALVTTWVFWPRQRSRSTGREAWIGPYPGGAAVVGRF